MKLRLTCFGVFGDSYPETIDFFTGDLSLVLLAGNAGALYSRIFGLKVNGLFSDPFKVPAALRTESS